MIPGPLVCRECRSSYIVPPEELVFYERMQACVPRLCPDCRMIEKLVWRNERALYRRECDMCKKNMLAMYHPRYKSPVYCNSCYHSDAWSGSAYGRPYDSGRSAWDQFRELMALVPKVALHTGTQVPSPGTEFQNFAGGNKDCYLAYNSAQNEECAYIRGLIDSKNSCDCYFGDQLDHCYQNVNVSKSSRVAWSEGVLESMNSYLCRDCVAVSNCFGCVNLRHVQFQFFNEQLTRADWEKRVSRITHGYAGFTEALRKFQEFEKRLPRRESAQLKSQNCTGNFLYESKDCFDCFEAFNCENCRYGMFVKHAKDSYDLVGRGYQAELLLSTVAVGSQCARVVGTWNAELSHDLGYCFDIRSSHDCMLCAGLKHARYCILNRQYGERDYSELRDRIVAELSSAGEYGAFLPRDLSPWSYNETLAQELYPKTKEEVLSAGFRYEEEIPRTRGAETVTPAAVPDSIREVPDSYLHEVLMCSSCGCNYRIVRTELELLRLLDLPIPRECISCRYLERLKRRGPFQLLSRTCAVCGRVIQTTYGQAQVPNIYCSECYQRAVV